MIAATPATLPQAAGVAYAQHDLRRALERLAAIFTPDTGPVVTVRCQRTDRGLVYRCAWRLASVNLCAHGNATVDERRYPPRILLRSLKREARCIRIESRPKASA